MTFKYTIETDSGKVNFQQVANALHSAGLASNTDVKQTEKSFRNSDTIIYIKDGNEVIGVGRALADLVSQGAIYNVAAATDHQGQHIGHTIITTLLEKLVGVNVILHTYPQTLTLYERYGFRRNKTAFAHSDHGMPESSQWMEDEGPFLPENYRFDSERGRY